MKLSGKFLSYGGTIKCGPGATTHKGGHLRELRAGKKRARRELRKETKKFLDEIQN